MNAEASANTQGAPIDKRALAEMDRSRTRMAYVRVQTFLDAHQKAWEAQDEDSLATVTLSLQENLRILRYEVARRFPRQPREVELETPRSTHGKPVARLVLGQDADSDTVVIGNEVLPFEQWTAHNGIATRVARAYIEPLSRKERRDYIRPVTEFPFRE